MALDLKLVKPVTIRETEDFTLRVGVSVMSRKNRMLCYQVVNKTYKVIESETTLLVNASRMILKAQAAMDELREMVKDGVDEHTK